MKKFFAIALIAIATTVASCDKNKGNAGAAGNDPASEDYKKGGTVLSPTDQQTKIENTALKAVDMVDPDAFKPSADLIRFFVENYLMDADLSEIEEAFGEQLENDYTYSEESYEQGTSLYVSIFESLIIDLSKYTGKITANSTKWTYEPAADLTVVFKDQNGKDCIIEIVDKGDVGLVPFISSYDSYIEYYPDIDGDGHADYEYAYFDIETAMAVELPEELNVSVKQAGEVLLEAQYKLKTNVLESEDFSNAEIDFSASFFFAGYKAEIKRAFFNGTAAEVSTSMSFVDKVIVSESVKLSNIEIDLESELGFKGGKVETKLNLLGEVQVNVAISNAQKFVECTEKECNGADQAKVLCDELNSYITAELHFDNTAAVQARIEFRVFAYEDGDWDVLPVLVFKDGSSYAIDEYITNEFMEKLAEKIENVASEIIGIIGE